MNSKKLQNSFNDFLPMNYRDFKVGLPNLTSNPGVVASLLRICCEEDDIKAIKLAFERILGKPEKVLVIKRMKVRMLYPEATAKMSQPEVSERVEDEVAIAPEDTKVVIDAKDAPGQLLRQRLDEMGDKPATYAYEVLENKNEYTVVEVVVANLYAIALRGSNLAAIAMLFDYLDGAVADVIRIGTDDTIMLENYAEVAPYEAKQDENGIYYVEQESAR